MPTVVAGFESRQAVECAIEQLLAHGFSRDSIRYEADPRIQPPPAELAPASRLMATIGQLFTTLTKPADSFADVPRFAKLLRRGGMLVSVHGSTDVEGKTARAIMRAAGALGDEDEESEPIEAGIVGASEEVAGASPRAIRVGELPVFKVDSAVRTRSDAADAATDADFMPFVAGTFEVPERMERLVVTKNLRVVEEIVLGKTVTVSSETVADTVRRTQVEVERTGA